MIEHQHPLESDGASPLRMCPRKARLESVLGEDSVAREGEAPSEPHP